MKPDICDFEALFGDTQGIFGWKMEIGRLRGASWGGSQGSRKEFSGLDGVARRSAPLRVEPGGRIREEPGGVALPPQRRPPAAGYSPPASNRIRHAAQALQRPDHYVLPATVSARRPVVAAGGGERFSRRVQAAHWNPSTVIACPVM